MQRLKNIYGGNIPQTFREKFRRCSLPLMKYANILTFNTRAIVLYIACLLDIPWAYLLFELTVMTALYFYMRARHESICRHLYNELDERLRNEN